tara:strand:- start:25595 stop:26995 length:1401 start_codon:yes stop_codon:yes gene_type:complete
MKVLLVFPEMSLKAPEQPLGILYLAACLREHGHEVAVVDMTPQGMDLPKLMDFMETFAPEVLGVSCMITTSQSGCAIAKATRERFPEIVTIVGGPNATAWPDHFVTLGGFDYAFVGEGEVYFTEFVNRLAAGDPEADQTLGLVYVRDEKVVHNPRAPRITDLDSLPLPARDLVDMSLYNHDSQYFISLGMIGKNFNIVLARGCPFQCNFCDHSLFGYKPIERSISSVLDEIQDVWERWRVPNMEIDDDTFTLKLDRVEEFCKGMHERGLSHIKWSARCRVSGVTPEIFQTMADAGCVHVSFGVESIDERVLKRIRKKITREQVDNATRWANQAGMHVVANFMIGNLGDDEASVMKSLDYALQNDNIHVPSFTVITPLKNTEVYDEAMKNGWIRNTEWDHYNQKTVNMRNEALSFEDIERLRQHIRTAIHTKVRRTMSEMERRWEEHMTVEDESDLTTPKTSTQGVQ